MKIFALYADVELTYQPAWLDAFRAKYDKPYPYHVTLKQPCYATEAQLAEIKQALASFFRGLHVLDHGIPVEFNRVTADEADGSIMMLAGSSSAFIFTLQKNLVSKLSGYNNYCELESEIWEKHFQPHITIGRDLTPRLLSEAKAEVRGADLPRGLITQIVLVAVDNPGPEEANRPENLTQYVL